jgi:AcrR family transcriptional regulator
MERIALAVEELLKEKPFEEISIQEIARKSGRPVGSFYARFGSKDALLPYLYERYDETLGDHFDARLARIDWAALDFEKTAAQVVDVLLALYDERRWLLRALVLFARLRPEALPAGVAGRRSRVYEPVTRLLLHHRARIRHADPEAAARFAVFLISSTAREKLLFPQAPLARVTPVTRQVLRDELVRVLVAYLTSEAPR